MKAQAYAYALFQLTDSADSDTQIKYITNLHSLLKRRGESSLYPTIVQAYERLATGRKARVASLTGANTDDVATYAEEIKQASQALSLGETPSVTVDTTLIGGFKVSSENAQWDASHKQSLISLYKQLVR